MNNSIDNSKLMGIIGLAAKAGKIVVGTEIVTGKIKSGKKILLVLIASDVSQNTYKKIVNCCDYYKVDYVQLKQNRDEISHAVGKSCLTSSVGIIDQNFVNAIKKLF